MKLCLWCHQGLYTWALRTLFVYTEFAKKKVFEQLTLAVACSARSRTFGWLLTVLHFTLHSECFKKSNFDAIVKVPQNSPEN